MKSKGGNETLERVHAEVSTESIGRVEVSTEFIGSVEVDTESIGTAPI